MVSSQEHRRQRIVSLATKGFKPYRIAEMVGTYPSTVYRVLQRFDRHGSTERSPGSGRRPSLPKRPQYDTLRWIQGHPGRSTRKAVAWLEGRGHHVSRTTLRRFLKRSGLVAFKPGRKFGVSPLHRARRLAFARRFRHEDFTRWVFSDESHIYLVPTPNPQNTRVWARNRTEIEPALRTHTSGGSLSVWAAISHFGKTKLYFYEGRLNSASYVGLLRRALADIKRISGGDPFVFMQDNAPCHASAASQDFLREKLPNFLPKSEWPASSPDLNPIENIWALLKVKTYEKAPRTMLELKAALLKSWDEISQSDVRKCTSSMQSRLKAVVKAGGGPTKRRYAEAS